MLDIAEHPVARVFGIACNTAHCWHAELSRLFPDLDITRRLLQPQLEALLARAVAVVLAGALAAKAYGTYSSPAQVQRRRGPGS
jgi:hypothetical protein